MERENPPSQSEPEFNPFEAPRAPIGPGKTRGPYDLAFPVDGSPSVSITHDLTEDDLRRLVDFDTFHDPLPLLGFIPQWVVVFAVLSVGTSWFFVRGNRQNWAAWGSGPCVGAFALWALARKHAANRHAALASRFCEGRTATVSPQGLLIRTPNLREVALPGPLKTHAGGFTPWSEIRKVETSDDYMTFWLKGRNRLMVPRRAFPTKAEADRFFDAARAWHSVVDVVG